MMSENHTTLANANGEILSSEMATVYARNAYNSLEFPLEENNVLRLDPRARKILQLLTVVLSECHDYRKTVEIEQNEINEAIDSIESVISLVISTEIGKIHSLIWNKYLPEK